MEELIIFLLEAQVYSTSTMYLILICMILYLVDFITKKDYFKTLNTTILLFILIQAFIVGVENDKVKNNSLIISEQTVQMKALKGAIERKERKNYTNN